MIIFLAGNGRKAEDIKELLAKKSDNWGVLLSFKDMQNKANDGGSRFQKLKKRKDANK